ncbi:hypothetical protein V1515DRAFT_609100 [Lipomyces mesembrius]
MSRMCVSGIAYHACFDVIIMSDACFWHLASPIPSTSLYKSACVLSLDVSRQPYFKINRVFNTLRWPPSHNKKDSACLGVAQQVLQECAGYEIITILSPKNFEYVRKLGASQIFEYKRETVIDDMVGVVKGKTIAKVHFWH